MTTEARKLSPNACQLYQEFLLLKSSFSAFLQTEEGDNQEVRITATPYANSMRLIIFKPSKNYLSMDKIHS